MGPEQRRPVPQPCCVQPLLSKCANRLVTDAWLWSMTELPAHDHQPFHMLRCNVGNLSCARCSNRVADDGVRASIRKIDDSRCPLGHGLAKAIERGDHHHLAIDPIGDPAPNRSIDRQRMQEDSRHGGDRRHAAATTQSGTSSARHITGPRNAVATDGDGEAWVDGAFVLWHPAVGKRGEADKERDLHRGSKAWAVSDDVVDRSRPKRLRQQRQLFGTGHRGAG